MIPVQIRTYKNSILASLIALIGTLIDALFKVAGLALLAGAISDNGFFPGIILGAVVILICIIIGSVIKTVIFRFSDWIAAKKLKKQITKNNQK